VVHARAAGTPATVAPEDVEGQAAAIEEQLVEVEEAQAAELDEAESKEDVAAATEQAAATARDKIARPDA